MAKLQQIVGFRVGKENFGVPIGIVHEIVRMMDITVVPDSPALIEGVINLRGKIIPVVDLRKRFAEEPVPNRRNRIMVAELDGHQVGLVVDAANEVLKLNPELIEPPPSIFEQGEAELCDRRRQTRRQAGHLDRSGKNHAERRAPPHL